MDQVRLHFVSPDSGESAVIPLDFAVIHMPKPRHARLEPSDTPIYDELSDEMWPPLPLKHLGGA